MPAVQNHASLSQILQMSTKSPFLAKRVRCGVAGRGALAAILPLSSKRYNFPSYKLVICIGTYEKRNRTLQICHCHSLSSRQPYSKSAKTALCQQGTFIASQKTYLERKQHLNLLEMIPFTVTAPEHGILPFSGGNWKFSSMLTGLILSPCPFSGHGKKPRWPASLEILPRGQESWESAQPALWRSVNAV